MIPWIANQFQKSVTCCLLLTAATAHASSFCDPCWTYEPTCCEEPCVAMWADWIYWNSCQDDFDVAITNADQTNTELTNAETKFFDFHYKPGFRIGVSYRLPCSGWSLEAIWTRLHSKQHETFDPNIGGEIISTQLPNNFVRDVVYAESHSELKTKYDVLDLLFAKTMCWGDCFRVRPYGGARFLWFKQKLTTDYFIVSGGSDFDEAFWRTDLPAGGVTLGFEGQYPLCGAISLIGHFGSSFLGGQVKHHQDWHSVGDDVAQDNGTWDSERRHHCQFIGGWDASIGINYTSNFCNCPWFVSVGYEIADWWNMPQRPRFVNGVFVGGEAAFINSLGQITSDSGSRLTFHGLFVRLGTAF